MTSGNLLLDAVLVAVGAAARNSGRIPVGHLVRQRDRFTACWIRIRDVLDAHLLALGHRILWCAHHHVDLRP